METFLWWMATNHGRHFAHPFLSWVQEKSKRINLTLTTPVQFSRSVVSDSLQPHGQQHARLPCPSPSPGACSNSCPSSQWCHPTISSSVVPFSYLQSFPASRFFPMNQLFSLGDQIIQASASASVLAMNIQDWFPLGLTGLISCCPADSQESSPTPQFKSVNSSVFSFMVQLSDPYMTTGKTIALIIRTFVGKVMSLLFNTLSRFVIDFLPRSKCLLFHGCSHYPKWLWSPRK